VKPTRVLPDDPALPGLVAIRENGLGGVLPGLGLDDGPVQLELCGYTPGERATLDARAGNRRFAVKVYAEDPVTEAELYEALAGELVNGAEARVPPLLARERDLRLLVIGWLEGPTADQLVRGGSGARAGELAARWLRSAASLAVHLGPPCGAALTLERVNFWSAVLAGADAGLGAAAAALARTLASTRPDENGARLVHGTLYDRHILDTGDDAGVIDWQRFGQGPSELDAGTFLATISRTALRHEHLAGEAARAEQALLAGTGGLLDERAVSWYRAVTLLRLASKPVNAATAEGQRIRRKPDWRALALARSRVLLDEAARHAEAAGRRH
jgi:aminoglycoside phosphotransferase (APT) family kinase protein